MNIKPLNNFVLVLPNEAEEKTAGGLFIPDNAKETPFIGKVIAIGPGTAETPIEVEVGNTVYYGKYMGTEIDVEGTQHLLLPSSAIYAIVEE